MKTISFMGDSITTYEGANPPGYDVYYSRERLTVTGVTDQTLTWWCQVAAGLDATVLANASFSGSMVEGAGFPAACDPKRARDLAPEGIAPDIVVIFMGVNDYGWGSAYAQAAGRSAATPPCTDLASIPEAVAGRADAQGLLGFKEAYARMLSNIRGYYPAAAVYCCTIPSARQVGIDHPAFCWNLRGIPLADYNRVIRETASGQGCLVADVAAYAIDYEASDGTHPTRFGMYQLASMVLTAIRGGELPADILVNGEGVDMGAADRCDRYPCCDCPHAKGTTNAWYCVCLK